MEHAAERRAIRTNTEVVVSPAGGQVGQGDVHYGVRRYAEGAQVDTLPGGTGSRAADVVERLGEGAGGRAPVADNVEIHVG